MPSMFLENLWFVLINVVMTVTKLEHNTFLEYLLDDVSLLGVLGLVKTLTILLCE